MPKQIAKHHKKTVRHGRAPQHAKAARGSKRARAKKPAVEEQVVNVTAVEPQSAPLYTEGPFAEAAESMEPDVVEMIEIEVIGSSPAPGQNDESGIAAELPEDSFSLQEDEE